MTKNPNTNAEAQESYYRFKIAELGALYLDLFYYDDGDVRKEFYLRGEQTPNKVFDCLDRAKNLNKRVLAFVEEQFDARIRDFINAYKVRKADLRPRDEILKSEGWVQVDGGWERTEKLS